MSTIRMAVALGMVFSASGGCATEPTFREELKPLLRAQIERCYTIPSSAKGSPSVTLEFQIAADGTFAQAPAVVTGDPDSPIAKSAILSLSRCIPFAIPSSMAARLPKGLLMRVEFDSR